MGLTQKNNYTVYCRENILFLSVPAWLQYMREQKDVHIWQGCRFSVFICWCVWHVDRLLIEEKPSEAKRGTGTVASVNYCLEKAMAT